MGAISALGSIIPVIGEIVGAAKTVQSVVNLADGGKQKLEQTKAVDQLKQQQLEQKTALEQQQLDAQAAADAETRRQALIRAVAKQRASYGAQGLDTTNGSPEAVLLGIYGDEDAAQAQADQINNLRSQSLDLGPAQSQSLNLLQEQQLAQRNALNRLG